MDESIQYIFFFSSFLLSIVIGLFLLIRYWSHKIIRLAGLYTIKPAFAFIFATFIPYSIIYDYRQYQSIVGLEIILSIAIVCICWESYKIRWGAAWLLLLVDFLKLPIIYAPSLAYSYATNLIYYSLIFFPAIFVAFFRRKLMKHFPDKIT